MPRISSQLKKPTEEAVRKGIPGVLSSTRHELRQKKNDSENQNTGHMSEN